MPNKQTEYTLQQLKNLSADTSVSPPMPKEGIVGKAAGGAYYDVAVDTDGNLQVDVVGGSTAGTQYTEGDVDASVTGTAVMWEDTSDTMRAVSAAKPLPVNVVAGGAGDGSILDGVSSSIKASVLDYTNSNPLAVRLTDTNGDYIAAGAGTQYTEDVAAAADPIGTMGIAVRADTLAAVTNTDGDNIALRATNKGELYVKQTDAIPVTDNSGSLTVDGTVAFSNTTIAVTNAGTFATQATLQTGDNTVGRVKLTDGTDVADILDLTNSNPLTVAIVDGSGDQISSFGGGTQYTEDAASAANPVATALNLVRDDARGGSLTTTDGDNVAARGTNAGELYVKHVDTIPVTQSGTWTVQPGNTANTTAWKVDASSVAVPVTDNSGSLTVDYATTGSGTATGALRVELPTNGTGVIATVGAVTSITNAVTVNSHAVTNAGTFAVQVDGNALTALQLIDDPVFTDDTAFTPATSKVSMIGAEVDDTGTDSVDEGDAGAVRMSANRNLYVRIRDNAGNERGLNIDANGALAATVTNATAANLNMTEASAASSLTALQLIDDGVYTDDTSTHSTGTSKGYGIMAAATPTDASVNANDIGMVAMTTDRRLLVDASGVAVPVTDNSSSLSVDWNGTQPVTGSGTATGALRVELANNGTGLVGLNAGTNNIGDVDILTIAAGDNNIGNVDIVTMPNVTLSAGTNTNEVVGDVAHDTAVGGNPVLIAGVSQAHDDTAPPNRVSAESDTTRFATDFDGSLFVRPHGPQVWTYHVNGSSALTDASVHSAPGAGLSLYVGTIVFSSGAATAINMFLEEGASTVIGPYYLEATAGRGMSVQFNPPRKITANTALTITTSAAIAHSVDITGFTAQG